MSYLNLVFITMVDLEKEYQSIEVGNLTMEQESDLEDTIIGSLMVEESNEGAQKSIAKLIDIERESPNNRAKDKIFKVGTISAFKCNGSNVGNTIISTLIQRDSLFDMLKENLNNKKESMDLEELGDLVETLAPIMNSKRLFTENKSELAKHLFNIFLIINEQRRKV
jgi:hypothetical protein